MRLLTNAALLALAACEGPFVPPAPYPARPAQPASVTVTPDSGTVITDDTLRLQAQVRDSAGNVLTGTALSWVSTDTTVVVIVNALGTVRGLRPGTALVRAFAGAIAGAVTVFVTPVVYDAIATGATHACAIANNQHAYCWGKNDDAQVGIGSSTPVEPTPRHMALVPALGAITAGSVHSCVLDLRGTAYCWGRESSGRLGRDGTPGDPAIPDLVSSNAHFTELAGGGAHTCGLDMNGEVICWGADGSGQLGDGLGADRAVPQVVVGDTRWLAVSTGATHTCAVATDATGWCWGGNASGQVGDSSTTDRQLPTAVLGGLTFLHISAGGSHTCAVAAGGTATCWGLNARGQTGTGLPDSLVLVPTPVAGGRTFRTVTAGGQHACGITTDSLAYCWGANTSGQVGDSSQADRTTPVLVRGGLHFADVRAGAAFTCGLTGGLVLYCWGDGTLGQLGRAFLASSTVPVKVAGQ